MAAMASPSKQQAKCKPWPKAGASDKPKTPKTEKKKLRQSIGEERHRRRITEEVVVAVECETRMEVEERERECSGKCAGDGGGKGL
uniref:Uncharacterized protein n=1 Tax=Salix viminalis TaxID=40686 RepID=A0A6N2KJE5_SALVM